MSDAEVPLATFSPPEQPQTQLPPQPAKPLAYAPCSQVKLAQHIVPTLQSDVQTVPVMAGPPGDGRGARLTSAQQEELEMARRRAEKAAKGKAANTAAVARRAKRRNSYSSDRSDDDLQQKLSTVTDEKEAKRLKRLLRNRVSAQQARERKKSYVATLEEKCQDQEQRIAEQQQRLNTLERENVMLRCLHSP